MGIIERHLTIVGNRGKKSILAFFDSGSSFTLIKRSHINQIGYYNQKKVNINIETASKNHSLHILDEVLIDIKMNDVVYPFVYPFWVKVSNDIPEAMIIGVDFLEKFGHTLEFTHDTVKAKNLRLRDVHGNYRV